MISASRRTDMLANQPDRLLAALTGRCAFASRLSPERVHTLLISTKDYRPLLDVPELGAACRRCDQVCMNLTVTGLGGTPVEPGVPPPEALLARLPELVAYLGDPRRLTWCYDPILSWQGCTNHDVEMFQRLAACFAHHGIARVMAMFYFPYARARIQPDRVTEEEKLALAGRLDAVCRELGLTVSVCHVGGYHRLKCVDLAWYASLHPTQDASPLAHYRKVRARRASSHCRDAIWDIGWYLPACKHGCLYCYGNAEQGCATR